jgi:hypothetical protein
LPFFTYAACIIFYFSYYFLDSPEAGEITTTEKTLKIMIYVLNIYIGSFEVV